MCVCVCVCVCARARARAGSKLGTVKSLMYYFFRLCCVHTRVSAFLC